MFLITPRSQMRKSLPGKPRLNLQLCVCIFNKSVAAEGGGGCVCGGGERYGGDDNNKINNDHH